MLESEVKFMKMANHFSIYSLLINTLFWWRQKIRTEGLTDKFITRLSLCDPVKDIVKIKKKKRKIKNL